MTLAEILVLFTAAIGIFFSFVASFGMLRMPTAMTRLHCTTKAATLGVGFLVLAAAVHFNDSAVGMRAFAVIAFLLLTAPIAAHAIARTAARSYNRAADADINTGTAASEQGDNTAANNNPPV